MLPWCRIGSVPHRHCASINGAPTQQQRNTSAPRGGCERDAIATPMQHQCNTNTMLRPDPHRTPSAQSGATSVGRPPLPEFAPHTSDPLDGQIPSELIPRRFRTLGSPRPGHAQRKPRLARPPEGAIAHAAVQARRPARDELGQGEVGLVVHDLRLAAAPPRPRKDALLGDGFNPHRATTQPIHPCARLAAATAGAHGVASAHNPLDRRRLRGRPTLWNRRSLWGSLPPVASPR